MAGETFHMLVDPTFSELVHKLFPNLNFVPVASLVM